jgi:hypothetical protein
MPDEIDSLPDGFVPGGFQGFQDAMMAAQFRCTSAFGINGEAMPPVLGRTS